jgi:hypothetical protein
MSLQYHHIFQSLLMHKVCLAHALKIINISASHFPHGSTITHTTPKVIAAMILLYFVVNYRMMFRRNLYLNTSFFADEQVIIQDSEDKLQKSVYILNQLSKDYNLKISTDKTKIMTFKRKILVRSKI